MKLKAISLNNSGSFLPLLKLGKGMWIPDAPVSNGDVLEVSSEIGALLLQAHPSYFEAMMPEAPKETPRVSDSILPKRSRVVEGKRLTDQFQDIKAARANLVGE